MTTNTAALGGRQLFHAIWETVQSRFWDRTRLGDWLSWEHRFDDVIDSDETALSYASQMLASLNDPYTRLIPVTTANQADDSSPMTCGSGPEQSHQEPEEVTGSDDSRAEKPVMAAIIGDNIGYLRIMSFQDRSITDSVDAAVTRLAGCDGIIVDLRFNPGGLIYVAADCAEPFIHKGIVTIYEEYTPAGIVRHQIELSYDPHVCIWTDQTGDGQQTSEQYKRRPSRLAGKPIVILTSAITASSAEMFVMAVIINGYQGLRSLVGQTTLGKALVQHEVDILGKVVLRLSVGRYLSPQGDFLGNGDGEAPDGIEPLVVVDNDTGSEGIDAGMEEVRRLIAASREKA